MNAVTKLPIDVGTGSPSRDAVTVPLAQRQPASTPSKYSDECDATHTLVLRFFESAPDACQRCVYFRELSETCEALEDGMAECCPELPDLIEQEVRSMQDEHEAGYP